MKLTTLPREPEPEVMDAPDEAAAYASSAAQAHLEALDNAFVARLAALGIERGWALDVGTGPGQIPLILAQRCPGLCVIAVDRSPAMLKAAAHNAREKGLGERVRFVLADAAQLCFPAARFDLVFSNSLLHHLNDPAPALNEMARVARPAGGIVLRDLRRPSRLRLAAHVAWHGRHYSGLMKKLFEDSVRAAYTPSELRRLLDQSDLGPAEVFLEHGSHLGFIRTPRAGGAGQ